MSGTRDRIFNKAPWKPIETVWGVTRVPLKRLEGNKHEKYCITVTFCITNSSESIFFDCFVKLFAWYISRY